MVFNYWQYRYIVTPYIDMHFTDINETLIPTRIQYKMQMLLRMQSPEKDSEGRKLLNRIQKMKNSGDVTSNSLFFQPHVVLTLMLFGL